MKDKVIVAMSLVVAGVMTYLMFAGFGMMSWLVREGLKLISDVKKEFEK